MEFMLWCLIAFIVLGAAALFSTWLALDVIPVGYRACRRWWYWYSRARWLSRVERLRGSQPSKWTTTDRDDQP